MRLFYVSHPEVEIDPARLVPRWPLSGEGLERVKSACGTAWVQRLTGVMSSDETKALETAALFAMAAGVPMHVDADAGEVDRSSTGYVAAERHEALRRALFGAPEQSADGWERAVDAQARIVGAANRFLATAPEGDVAIVGHGAVGSFLWCHYAGNPISLDADQPFGGHVWAVSRPALDPIFAWRRLEDVPQALSEHSD